MTALLALLAMLGTTPEPERPVQPPTVPEAGEKVDDLAWFVEQVRLLDAEDLGTREDAALRIASDPRTNLALVERMLSQGGMSLSPEQRERLTRLATGFFRNEPRAGMGVSFARFDGREGVEIAGTVEGFDARRVLRPGDIIRSMSGIPVRFNDEARAVILSHDPGETISVEVVRAGEVRTLSVVLGRFSDLRNAAEPEDAVLAGAWELRCARRLGLPATRLSEVLDPGLPQSRWVSLRSGSISQTTRANAQVVVPWGESKQPEGPARLLAGGEGRGVPTEVDIVFTERQGWDDNPQIAGLLANISELSRRIANGEARLRAGTLNANERRLLDAQLDRERTLRRQLMEQLNRLREKELLLRRMR
jgi:hypothetical protein